MIAQITCVKDNLFEINPGSYGIKVHNQVAAKQLKQWSMNNTLLDVIMMPDDSLSIKPLEHFALVPSGNLPEL